MAEYSKTPIPNLVRHSNGTYYLRARFGAGPVRVSLKTDKYSTARLRLDKRLEEMRHCGDRTGEGPTTLQHALMAVRAEIVDDPSLKQTTRDSYTEQLGALIDGTAKVPGGEIRVLAPSVLRTWWKNTAAQFAPRRANHMLMWVKRAIALAKKYGTVRRDPAESLHAVKVPKTRLTLLSKDQFVKLIAHIRQKRSRHDPHEAGDWVEFITYCGMRPAEVSALRWEDINERAGVISVYGGKEGTKNRKHRRIPITPMLTVLLQSMRKHRGNTSRGVIFKIKTPYVALRGACKRLKFPHQRVYDLRHTFATICAQSGVDIPTISRWLGHSDGGALAMKTYIHPDDAHSLEAVKKVAF